MKMINLKINDTKINVESGKTILEYCVDLGIDIPTFCHDERIKPEGSCRMCLVEVKGINKLLTSCTTPATDGMEIKTHSSEVMEASKDVLDLTWASHPND